MSAVDPRLDAIVARLRERPGLAARLPGEERAMVQAALRGEGVQVIAQEQGVSAEAVWAVLDSAANQATGSAPAAQVEVGGLGSDSPAGEQVAFSATGADSFGDLPPASPPEDEPPAGGRR